MHGIIMGLTVNTHIVGFINQLFNHRYGCLVNHQDSGCISMQNI